MPQTSDTALLILDFQVGVWDDRSLKRHRDLPALRSVFVNDRVHMAP